MKRSRVNLFGIILNAVLLALVGYGAVYLTFKGGNFVDQLKFFTVLSNLLAGVSALIGLISSTICFIKDKRGSNFVYIAELTSLVGLMITFFTVLLFLGPVAKIDWAILYGNFSFTSANFFMHFVIPLFALVTFIFTANTKPHSGMNWKTLFFTLIPLAGYGIFYIINFYNHICSISFSGGVSYDWYGFFSISGEWLGYIMFVLLFAIGYGFAFGLAKLNFALQKVYFKKDEIPPYEDEFEDNEEIDELPKIEAPVVEKVVKEDKEKKQASKESGTKVYHLTKRKEDGMWAITFVGGQKAVKLFKTKKEAEAALAILTENQGATALIKNSKGAKAGKFASSIKSEKD